MWLGDWDERFRLALPRPSLCSAGRASLAVLSLPSPSPESTLHGLTLWVLVLQAELGELQPWSGPC